MIWDEHAFSRTEILLGSAALEKLRNSSVAVFGVGGVGGYCTEALARSGIGRIALIDKDLISISNLNRQIIATTSSIGRPKVDVMKERINDINPQAIVEIYNMFYNEETSDQISLKDYDYIVDAIDTVSSKITLILKAKAAQTMIISCMGAGNKLDPTRFEVTDIYKTSVCPLARVMRYELRKRGVGSLKVVYSKEQPIKQLHTSTDTIETSHVECSENAESGFRKQVPGSVSFVPSVAGLIIAGEVIKALISQ
ncbi:MAG: tRNA threonylcarbamoyladenosine dehydratase [Eubacteriales bacterium]|jgi:tRNA A37 threonylcarbamoyladenosine dehydratase